jgi:glycosyltransferase involved in cell wall biosynthesis
MKIAVIITTYNSIAALSASLEGFLAQKDVNFEIVVADDGSGPETAKVIHSFQKRADFEVSHVWQDDLGFRAGAIRNRALAQTKADYVIFTDGDCIPMPDFVSGHRCLAERGWFVTGNRILLGEALSRQILEKRLPVHHWPVRKWFAVFLRGEVNRWLPLCRLPVPGLLRKLPARRWQGAMTCNLAAWRENLLNINGFDETYAGWGLEDSDLTIRLIRSGIYRKSARFAAPVIHLWHKENDRFYFEKNKQRLDELVASNRILASKGASQYL